MALDERKNLESQTVVSAQIAPESQTLGEQQQ